MKKNSSTWAMRKKEINMLVSEPLVLFKEVNWTDGHLEEKRKRRKMEEENKTFQYSYDSVDKSNVPQSSPPEERRLEEPEEEIKCNFRIPDDILKVSLIQT
jgi:hypothetical protein